MRTKTKMLRIVSTRQWGIRPEAGHLFRIGGDAYYCYFTFLGIAVMRFDHTMSWEW
jgi:hypothetical protein